jgi:glycosyltransferase involved in cell wall biosynthesis
VLSRRSRRDFGWRAAKFLLALRYARWRGTRVVWTVHNLKPHEQDFPSRRLATLFWKLFPQQVDCFISMTRVGVEAIHERCPVLRKRHHEVIHRGHYPGEYPDEVDREHARRRLGLPADASVYVFLGLIRAYKDVPALIRVFGKLPDRDSRLVVAGRPHDDALARDVEQAAAGDERVLTRLEFVPPAEVQLYLKSADLVVLPYAEIFNSGAALLALSFGRPILVPDVPTFRELQENVGSEWVRTYSGAITSAALQEGMTTGLPDEPVALDRYDWEAAAAQTLALYRTSLDRS